MITIIGAGLSGLATAYRLHQAGIPFSVLEAKPVAGGRVQPASINSASSYEADGNIGHQDLGPSWVWPYAQPVVVEWLDELGLKTFDQYDAGDALIDTAENQQAQQRFLPGQHGIARVHGGTHAIARALLATLSAYVQVNQAVKQCSFSADEIRITVAANSNEASNNAANLIANAVVIATPPRQAVPLVSEHIEALSKDQQEFQSLLQMLQQVPTWMAPHAKVVMYFETAFWRERGLSGRVASQVGPLAEMHDHSGPKGSPAALFGFVGLPAKHRANTDALIDAVRQQLARCFGKDAPMPIKIVVKDWAFDKYTCTESDLAGAGAHPSVINSLARRAWCNNRLWFAGAETASVSPGLIEGALARADEVAAQIIALRKS